MRVYNVYFAFNDTRNSFLYTILDVFKIYVNGKLVSEVKTLSYDVFIFMVILSDIHLLHIKP